jgi:hypothetical protein
VWAFYALDPIGANASGSGSPSPSAASATDLKTAAVETRDLTASSMTSCPVDYGEEISVGTTATGTVTKLPAVEDIVGPGDSLMRLDDSPVTILKGSIPAWRDFTPWMDDGRDIAQLKKALIALGYLDKDDVGYYQNRWYWALSEAIMDFQEARGLERDDDLARHSILFLPRPVRISSLTLSPGDPVQPGTTILAYTGTEPRITCSLATSERRYAVHGHEVTLEFPDGTKGAALITATTPVPASSPDQSATIDVTIEAPEVEGQENGTVAKVTFTDSLAMGVKAVPVTALVAFTDGGYGVQRVTSDNSLEYVAVATGQFADSWVEITSADPAVGDKVVVTP